MLHPNQPANLGPGQVKSIFASGGQFTLYVVTDRNGPDRLGKVPTTKHLPAIENEAAILQKLHHPNIIRN